MRTQNNLYLALQHFEREFVASVVEEYPDKRDAAKQLGIGLATLYRKLSEHEKQKRQLTPCKHER